MKKAVKTRVGIKHIKPSKRRFKPFAGPPGYCRIARDVDLDVSTSMMCGVSEFKDIRIPWTILYDEYFYGISGTLTIRVGRKAYRWVGEMEEIAATFKAAGLWPRLFLEVADIYRRIDATAGSAQDLDTIARGLLRAPKRRKTARRAGLQGRPRGA